MSQPSVEAAFLALLQFQRSLVEANAHLFHALAAGEAEIRRIAAAAGIDLPDQEVGVEEIEETLRVGGTVLRFIPNGDVEVERDPTPPEQE